MLMNRCMFYKRLTELIKRDDSYYNVICQIIHDHELCGEEVGEWIKDDVTLMQNLKAEFGKKENINDLF